MALPVLVFDYRNHPELADNIWNAQMAGGPKILTYNGTDPLLRRQFRRDAMHFDHGGAQYEIPRLESRDEYPFACTLEGGGRSWVGHVPPRQNSAQGGLIAAFLRTHHIVAGGKFVVKVANHPRGAVTSPCRPPCAGCGAPCRN